MKKLLLPLILVVGCTVPHDYVDPARPQDITLEDLSIVGESIENHYQTYNQVEGIIWQAVRSHTSIPAPDRYGSGGDSAIFGGLKLAADVFRYRVTMEWADLLKVEQSLRGLFILTHITGAPGAIARCAFPVDDKVKWDYPSRWQHRIDMGFCHESKTNVRDPFRGRLLPKMVYYTRATKDQLTGLLFGLGVTWRRLVVSETQDADEQELISKCRKVVAQITSDIYKHLRKHDFKIRDEKGENETNSDTVSGLIKLQLLAVYKETVRLTDPSRATRMQEKFDDQIRSSLPSLGDFFHIFNNYNQYYAWNLRHLRGYTVYTLSDNEDVKQAVRDWYDSFLWGYIKGHQNAWFIYLHNIVDPSKGKLDEAGLAMRSMALRPVRGIAPPQAGDERKPDLLQVLFTDIDKFILPPHRRKSTSYFLWQKEPWDTGGGLPLTPQSEDPTGLDFILPYWMAKFYGLLR